MRLPLMLARALAALAVLAPGAAGADSRAASWTEIYTDNDRVTVVSQQVGARADVHEKVELDATYDVDVISAASIDVVTAASPRGYTEVRHGLTLGGRYQPVQGTRVGLHYRPSWEPDYESHGLALSLSREWLERRLTSLLDYRINFDSVGRLGDDRRFWRGLTTHAVGAGLGWVLTAHTVVDLLYELQVRDGFQASPYRFVPLFRADEDTPLAMLPEAVPTHRLTQAVALRVRHAFSPVWFTSASYRFYFDDWGLRSHTAAAKLERTFVEDRLILALSLRGYDQSAARFYQAHYEAPAGSAPQYRVLDKVLASSWSFLGSVLGEYRLGPYGPLDRLFLSLKLAVLEQHFRDFPLLPVRRAFIGSLGVSAEF